jgi:hypothetical protein
MPEGMMTNPKYYSDRRGVDCRHRRRGVARVFPCVGSPYSAGGAKPYSPDSLNRLHRIRRPRRKPHVPAVCLTSSSRRMLIRHISHGHGAGR